MGEIALPALANDGALYTIGHSTRSLEEFLSLLEAVPRRCHRSMIADAEAARGIPVRHIMNAKTANPTS